MEAEKGQPAASKIEHSNATDLHEFNEREGYLITDAAHVELRRAPDGQTILLPQPSDDPSDPLNWSKTKKHLILIIVSMTAFLPDYGSATGAVTLLPQAEVWGMTPDHVNHSQVSNVFMLGAGGVVAVALSAYFGRLPVLFYFLVLATATAIWCAAAVTFESFMAARILNGFFSTVAQGGGLMFIFDMFYFHERARKINIWVRCSIALSNTTNIVLTGWLHHPQSIFRTSLRSLHHHHPEMAGPFLGLRRRNVSLPSPNNLVRR